MASNAQNRAEELAPLGMDENTVNLFDQVEILGTQPQSLYPSFTASDEEGNVLGRLCLARLATTVKSLGTCEALGLQPYTSDPGIAGVIQQINRDATHFLQTQELLMKSSRCEIACRNCTVSF